MINDMLLLHVQAETVVLFDGCMMCCYAGLCLIEINIWRSCCNKMS